MAGNEAGDVSIGKFDILATYTYAKGLLDGLYDGEARERGMVSAIVVVSPAEPEPSRP